MHLSLKINIPDNNWNIFLVVIQEFNSNMFANISFLTVIVLIFFSSNMKDNWSNIIERDCLWADAPLMTLKY